MTSWEIDEYARQFQIPPERFRHIPWPLLDDAANPEWRSTFVLRGLKRLPASW